MKLISPSFPAFCGRLSYNPPLHADLWELVWNVLIAYCIFFLPHVPPRGGRRCSCKQVSSQWGNRWENAQRDCVQANIWCTAWPVHTHTCLGVI